MKHRLLTRLHRLRDRVQSKQAAHYQRAVLEVEDAKEALQSAHDALSLKETSHGLAPHELERRTLVVRQREHEVVQRQEDAQARQRELTQASIDTRRAELLRDQALAAFRQADAKNQQKLLDDLGKPKERDS